MAITEINEGIHLVKPSVAFNDPVAVISSIIATLRKYKPALKS